MYTKILLSYKLQCKYGWKNFNKGGLTSELKRI